MKTYKTYRYPNYAYTIASLILAALAFALGKERFIILGGIALVFILGFEVSKRIHTGEWTSAEDTPGAIESNEHWFWTGVLPLGFFYGGMYGLFQLILWL